MADNNDFVTLSRDDYAALVNLIDKAKTIIDMNNDGESISEDPDEYCEYSECPIEKVSEAFYPACNSCIAFECIVTFGLIISVVAYWFTNATMAHSCHIAMTICASFAAFFNSQILWRLGKVSGILATVSEEETDETEPVSDC